MIIVMRKGSIEQIGTPREIYLHPRTRGTVPAGRTGAAGVLCPTAGPMSLEKFSLTGRLWRNRTVRTLDRVQYGTHHHASAWSPALIKGGYSCCRLTRVADCLFSWVRRTSCLTIPLFKSGYSCCRLHALLIVCVLGFAGLLAYLSALFKGGGPLRPGAMVVGSLPPSADGARIAVPTTKKGGVKKCFFTPPSLVSSL